MANRLSISPCAMMNVSSSSKAQAPPGAKRGWLLPILYTRSSHQSTSMHVFKPAKSFLVMNTLPSTRFHKIVAPEGEMDVDIEEHEDCKTEDELYDEYGYEVYGESQAY